jgi:hypothetical protein
LNIEKTAPMPNCPAFCETTEGPSNGQKTNLSSWISIFSPRFWTTIFWLSVLYIITTQNANFSCVRAALHKCSMLRIALNIQEKSFTRFFNYWHLNFLRQKGIKFLKNVLSATLKGLHNLYNFPGQIGYIGSCRRRIIPPGSWRNASDS